MVIKEGCAGAVEDLIHFFYSGEVRSSENVMDLFCLADMYNVPSLRLICEEIIQMKFDESNVIEVYNLGNLYSSKALKRIASDEIKAMFPKEKLDETLFNDPTRVNSLVDSKRWYEDSLSQCTKKSKRAKKTPKK